MARTFDLCVGDEAIVYLCWCICCLVECSICPDNIWVSSGGKNLYWSDANSPEDLSLPALCLS